MTGSKKGRPRRYTEDDFREIVALADAEGVEAVEKTRNLKRVSALGLIARARKALEPAPAPRRKGSKPARPSPMALTKAVGAFIYECQAGYLNGSGKVTLGALAGFPSSTTDPETVRRAIEVMRDRIADAKTPITELKARQRVRDLEYGLEALEVRAQGSANREIFVAYGAEWAEGAGIDYETFRDMGVPAEALREAGITRG